MSDPPRRASWLRLLRTRWAKVVGVVALCYVVALAVVNLSSSSFGWVIDRAFPHIGVGGSLDQSSIAAEWSQIQRDYVIRGVDGNVGTQGGEAGIVGLLGQMFNDRFSAYLTKAEYAQLTAQLSGRRSGSVGIALEARCAGETVCAAGAQPTEVVIEDVLTGSPAEQAGIRFGDVLVAVAGHSLTGLGSTLDAQVGAVSGLIRGPAGTTVTITVRRSGEELALTARRANLQIPSVFSRQFGAVLYLQVTGFDTDTGGAARSMLQAGIASGATSVILDLRGNGGGFVAEAQALASQFLQPAATEQDVVVRRGRMTATGGPSSAETVIHDQIEPGGVALTQPLVVLVDGNSASASEIVASALRDYHRATLVGERTFGKGSVQLDFPLPDGSDLHLTVERWYGPDGESIDGSGIQPAEEVALGNPDARFRLDAESPPASGDAQLQAALTALGSR